MHIGHIVFHWEVSESFEAIAITIAGTYVKLKTNAFAV